MKEEQTDLFGAEPYECGGDNSANSMASIETGQEAGDALDLHPHPYQRHTSKEAWESVLSSGWATKMAKLAYTILYEHGPLTLLELEHEAAHQLHHAPKGRSESTVIRRLYDLRDNGLTAITPLVRKCNISGKNAVTWDVTNTIAPTEKVEVKEIIQCPRCGARFEKE